MADEITIGVTDSSGVGLTVNDAGSYVFTDSAYVPMRIVSDDYEGPYTVTPTGEQQTLETNDLHMVDDVTVEAAPLESKSVTVNAAGSSTISPSSGNYGISAVDLTVPQGKISMQRPSMDNAYGEVRSRANVTSGYVATSGTYTSSALILDKQAAKTVTPSTSQQVAVDQYRWTTGQVIVDAMTIGSAATPDTTITANPTPSVAANGLVTATVSATQSVTPTVSAGYVDSGTAGTVSVTGSGTLQLETQAASTITPTESQQTAVAAGKFTTGAITVDAIPSDYVGTAIDRRDGTDLTASGDTISVPAGYYEAATSKAVGHGSEGVPVATKGTVSGHSVAITPSVTNTAGYVSGGTHTGTAVTVAASDLVSGNLAITSSGTKDVANYATASVAAGAVSNPTASKSITGNTATVTPTVTNTAGYVTAGTKTGTAVTVTSSELVSGTRSITSNGTGIDVTDYAAVDVAVPGGAPNLQAKTGITPSTSSQTISADTGYDGLSSVQIDAMPSGVVVPATAISSSSGATITTETGKIVLTKTVNNVPQVTTAGYVISGTLGDTSVTLRAAANIQGAQTITPGTTDQTIAANTWLTGAQTISGDQNLSAGNIKSGVSIFNITGTYTGGGGGSVQFDTKTASGGSTYPVSLQFTGMKGEPKAFVCRLNAQVSSSGSTTYYYIVDVSAFGTTTHGNCFRIGSTRRVDNITSGYSWSYSGTTLTITSSAASRSASPGAFHSGSYELLYCY